MNKRLFALLPMALIMSITAQSAFASFWSGSKLFQWLEQDLRGQASYEQGAAIGYIVGVSDFGDGVLFCMPSGATVGQVKQVVYNYMQKHPEAWDKSADFSIAAALQATWKCAK
ncbi:Rap1a/Tai family immunity protein [Variovorax sp. PBL-E5]|uniref:Rap1a/Tai family immunity protein n=1 Tax=Variovorax sp. PBL-E5 TaxID=434014 RepID=UPI0013164111|nr:Rap1a/Tai family immunity protein [Variovorax sp. PBL-E5]VTU28479.1 hypothetical protein E5CHR_02617 [Variovorax sp. PBL-E5]